VSAQSERWLWQNGRLLFSTACAALAHAKQAAKAATLAIVSLAGRNRFIHGSFRSPTDRPSPCRDKGDLSPPPILNTTPGRRATGPGSSGPAHTSLDDGCRQSPPPQLRDSARHPIPRRRPVEENFAGLYGLYGCSRLARPRRGWRALCAVDRDVVQQPALTASDGAGSAGALLGPVVLYRSGLKRHRGRARVRAAHHLRLVDRDRAHRAHLVLEGRVTPQLVSRARIGERPSRGVAVGGGGFVERLHGAGRAGRPGGA
jgi:hypothetical protein